MTTASASLRDYFLLEARHAPRRTSIVAALVGALVVIVTHVLVLRLPDGVHEFLELAFRIEGRAAVLLINDLLTIYFAAFFVAATALLDRTVSAREEGRLEMLLAKPIRGRTLLAARAWPSIAAGAATGIAIAAVTAIAVAPHLVSDDLASDDLVTGDRISAAGALGSGLALVALALFLLAALLPLLVRLRDHFQALGIAAAVWIAPLMPTAAFIYRPDAFEGERAWLADALLLPTLLWHDATTAWAGPAFLALAVLALAGSIAIAGRVLERSDSR